MCDEPRDPLFERLADLPTAAPSRASQDRVRARCHAALARQRQRTEAQRRAWALVDAAAFGTAALYLAAAITAAVRAASLSHGLR